ncbi:hypothetical protein HMPREF9374_0842 [Desmospora sp. 8437]|nr:hypothetical protein HMPREF9374_0842 [Desmospora sp. 8437]
MRENIVTLCISFVLGLWRENESRRYKFSTAKEENIAIRQCPEYFT